MKKKDYLVHKLCNDTSFFYKDKTDHFLCPACFKFINRSACNSITLAHIIPSANKGTLYTLLCSKCNNSFGAQQDKWFGEYLSLILDDQASIFSAKSKGKYIEINGIKIAAKVGQSDDGALDILLDRSRIPDSLYNRINFKGTLNISTKIKMFEHEREIEVGYLTAAYLLWFSKYGYSWILQDSLNIVREQMQNPEKLIIECSFTMELAENCTPQIALLLADGIYLPCALIYDKLVVFPNASSCMNYEDVSRLLSKDGVGKISGFRAYEEHKHPAIISIICDKDIIFLPEHVRRGDEILDKILFFPCPKSLPQWLFLEDSLE